MIPYIIVFAVGIPVFGTMKDNNLFDFLIRACCVGFVAHLVGL